MATLCNPLLKGLKGAVGKQLVFKQYQDKTVVTRYPDMSKVKPSEGQKEKRKRFAEAVTYATAINRDPQQKALYQKKYGTGKAFITSPLKNT